MAYAFPSAGALDYATCTYGASRLLFRGPKRDTEGAFVAILGGSECYGRCVKYPFPDLVEKELGLPVANFGLQNAGPDVFLNDPYVLAKAAQAAVAVVQLFGAQNISNRYYTVHPRRNDRFLAASPALRALYPNLDFTEFHFTRHLLLALQHASPSEFAKVAQGLQEDWGQHMRSLLAQIGGKPLLLWVADALPPPRKDVVDLFVNPMLIDAEMIAGLGPYAGHIVYAVPSPEARAMGLDGMVFDSTELPIAANLPGPYVHRELCNALLPHIEKRLGTRQRQA
jgi:hypothetical protein